MISYTHKAEAAAISYLRSGFIGASQMQSIMSLPSGQAMSTNDVVRVKLPGGRTHFALAAEYFGLHHPLDVICGRRMFRSNITLSQPNCVDCAHASQWKLYVDRTHELLAERIRMEHAVAKATAAIHRDQDAAIADGTACASCGDVFRETRVCQNCESYYASLDAETQGAA